MHDPPSLLGPSNNETWLICGGRDFCDRDLFGSVMRRLLEQRGRPSRIVHGDCRGADRMADKWCRSMGIKAIPVRAEWTRLGRAAGPIRNQRMLDEHAIDVLVAFPGNNGTADMVRRARKAGLSVIEAKPLASEPVRGDLFA